MFMEYISFVRKYAEVDIEAKFPSHVIESRLMHLVFPVSVFYVYVSASVAGFGVMAIDLYLHFKDVVVLLLVDFWIEVTLVGDA
mgnify:CR=1 FL=1